MASIKDDTIGGFNHFLQEQRQQPNHATMTLVQFDTQNPYEVLSHFVPLSEVVELNNTNFVPRAGTPLLDALGRGIVDLDTHIAKMPDAERPEQVVVLVITDGQENSSREFRHQDIKNMIQQKQDKQGWQFVFLSSDLSAIEDAENTSFSYQSSMSFDKTGKGVRSAFQSTSQRMSALREKKAKRFEFLEEDRAAQTSEQLRQTKPPTDNNENSPEVDNPPN